MPSRTNPKDTDCTLKGTRYGGTLLIADCARRNLFGDLMVPNPFAPSIEWLKHQQPKLWVKLLQKAGFESKNIRWTVPARCGNWGKVIFSNPVAASLNESKNAFSITCRLAFRTAIVADNSFDDLVVQ